MYFVNKLENTNSCNASTRVQNFEHDTVNCPAADTLFNSQNDCSAVDTFEKSTNNKAVEQENNNQVLTDRIVGTGLILCSALALYYLTRGKIKNAANKLQDTRVIRKSRNAYFETALKDSEKAMEEINQECFKSKTLRTMFYNPRFRSNDPNTVIVKSRTTGEPVKVYISDKGIKGAHDIYLFKDKFTMQNMKDPFKDSLGKKYFTIREGFLEKDMNWGSMITKADSDLIGLGIRLDEAQIKTAITKRIKKIPRLSVAQAIDYHLKMGFTPTSKLMRVRSETEINKLISEIRESAKNIPEEFYTPVVVKKWGIFGNRYYFDKNKTLAVAALRTVKSDLSHTGAIRPNPIRADYIDLELSGENLRVWKNMLKGKPMFKNVRKAG